jgi:hypothetical protein
VSCQVNRSIFRAVWQCRSGGGDALSKPPSAASAGGAGARRRDGRAAHPTAHDAGLPACPLHRFHAGQRPDGPAYRRQAGRIIGNGTSSATCAGTQFNFAWWDFYLIS